jgi:hypothetical protein
MSSLVVLSSDRPMYIEAVLGAALRRPFCRLSVPRSGTLLSGSLSSPLPAVVGSHLSELSFPWSSQCH